MEPTAECTHCGVVMTSWSVPGSPIRYFQCPFCARTHSSLYSEVFRRGAGARLVGPRPAEDGIPAAEGATPAASPEQIRWAGIRANAARWFARLDAELRHQERRPVAARSAGRAPPSIPLADPRHVIELRPRARGPALRPATLSTTVRVRWRR
ncbi:MAG TPA: hypothetical protein VFG59_18870 [Anaeromyxobacter sp.]|nr:hypothetical protein [Anaeromyxobacter sp.]